MPDDDLPEEDAERIDRVRGRRRRGRRKDRDDEQQTEQAPQGQQTQQMGQSQQTEQEEQTPQTQQAPQTPVTERNHDTFYLTDALRRELRTAGKQASLYHEMEFETELEKNRHLRPLILRLGMERLAEMDADEIRTRLESDDLLDDPPTK